MGGKRRNRQPDAIMHEASEDSSDSGDKANSGPGCPHIRESRIPLIVRNSSKKTSLDAECADCRKLERDAPSPQEEKTSLPRSWMCLTCDHLGCGVEENSHALRHYKSMPRGKHGLAADTRNWNIWCYNCEKDVTKYVSSALPENIDISEKKSTVALPVVERRISMSSPRTNDEDEKKLNSTDGCPHAAAAFLKSKVNGWFKKPALDKECAACKRLGSNASPMDEEGYSPAPLWICLGCSNQACGRNQRSHALEHHRAMTQGKHHLAANTQDWNIWCYGCDKDVTRYSSRQLDKVIELLKKKGFGSSPVNQQPIPLPFEQTKVDNDKHDNEKSESTLNGLTRVVGLRNLGNTCFFNAVLQCLSQTPFLIKVLEDLEELGEKFILLGGKCKSSEDSEEIQLPPIEGTLDGWGAFTSILCKTLKTMQSMKTRQTFVPNELLASFKKKTMQCMDGGQHDSHELLRHLLELVRNEDLRRYQSVILKKIGVGDSIRPNCVDEVGKAHLKFYGRQASSRYLGPELVFRGVLVSTLRCLECNHSSQRTEPFLDLSLPVMADKPQPPVLKRKSKGSEENIDSMGNNNVTSHATTKNQYKKEEKSYTEKSRKQLRIRVQSNNSSSEGDNYNDPTSNRISEEKQLGNVESVSDADVEDNISPPEIVESGYGSEKVSTVTSPVSPADDEISKNPSNSCNVTPENGNLPLSSNHEIFAVTTRRDNYGNRTNRDNNGKSPADVIIFFNKSTSNSNWLESPMNEGTSETGEFVSVSPSTSLIVNSELSPDDPTMSPLGSSLSYVEEQRNLSPQPSSPPVESEQAKLAGAAACEELRLFFNTSRISSEVYRENSDCRATENQEEESIASPVKLPEVKLENGLDDITIGLSKVTVSQCPQSHRYQTKDGDCSIQSCLNQFTAVELMCGSNKVGCEACTTRENKAQCTASSTKMVCTKSTMEYLISGVPPVLILHLKRFQSLRTGFRKVAKHVPFPMILDLAPICKGISEPKVYSLYGVVEHSGTLHGGHYVAYVKTRPPLTSDDPRWAFLPPKHSDATEEISSTSFPETYSTKSSSDVKSPPGNWYYVSDSSVMEVDEAAVLRSQAYILFYERIL